MALLLNSEELRKKVKESGYRLTTYGDQDVQFFMCMHGKVARKNASDHICIWSSIVKDKVNSDES